MSQPHFMTAEAVRAGHPDKLCDQIADRILDAHLKADPNARVAVEAFVTDAKILVAGEVTSKADVDYKGIIQNVLRELHYKRDDLTTRADGTLDLEVSIHEQSPDIAHAVGDGDDQGAGDQGIMVGYATDETPEYLPLPVVLAQRLCRVLDSLSKSEACLGADGKAQVTVAYENGRPQGVSTVVVSTQHSEDVCPDCLQRLIMDEVVCKVVPESLRRKDMRILINPSGRFILGGPVADTGLTGRKLAVDQYGPVARMGGGALSGKDLSKVDRSGAYAARWVAKNIVAAGLAKRCEVQIAYAIGQAQPVSVMVDAFGTSAMPNDVLARAVSETFDLRPAAIIRQLSLRAPIYAPLAVYGHYGRLELLLPWERMDRLAALIRGVLKCYDKV